MSLRRLILPLAGLALALSVRSAAAAQPPAGRLYGTVETTTGTRYTGVLRWDREEAFWDDLFNATKQDEPATGRLPKGYQRPKEKVEVFGIEIVGPWSSVWATRQFVARFGDIAEIRPQRGDRVEVEMKGGKIYRLGGGSNDVGADIRVQDAALGDVEVEWRRIRSIRFAATPAAVRPAGERLWARVKTRAGEFRGYLQWDSEEALTIDKLDGESDDGDLAIEMGKIRAIERASRRAAKIELADGRVLELAGTNDVDDSIRGVNVEDARYGRVEIPWESFERAEIEVAPDSGRGYDDYRPGRPIAARVRGTDGKTWSGTIAFDLDETESWELLDGSMDDVDYAIPFERVKAIRPSTRTRTLVELAGGETLRLEGPTDVSDDNAGVAFLGPELPAGAPDYLPWQEIAAIELW